MRDDSTTRILRLTEVLHRTGLSRSTIYTAQAAGIFPRSVRIGRRSVGWLSSEIDKWLEERTEPMQAEP